MTIHFAAARTANASVLARALRVPALRRAANDDPVRDHADAALDAALRHFALYGLAAADRAEQKARNADAQSDRDGVAHWLGICKTLDPRRARDAERNLTRGRATKLRR